MDGLAIPYWLWMTIGVVLGTGPVLVIVIWGYVWYRVEQSRRSIPTLRTGLKLANSDPPRGRVCVVVPAYNEAAVIGGLVASLRAEVYPQLRVVLALDRCTDDTEAIARQAIGGDDRFELVIIDQCPDDWAGKVHAVHCGVTRSAAARDAEFLLFADADTTFSPGCIAASLALMRARKLDLLSLLSTLTYETWFEQVVQMAASFELMRQYPLIEANARTGRRAFANGQFMLFTRDAYDAIGGHASVRKALLEDLALARRIEAASRLGGVFLAAGLFHCRMYPSWEAFRRGWKRIFTEAANRKQRRLIATARRTRWLGTILPVWMFVACAATPAVVAFDTMTGSGGRLTALCLLAVLTWGGALSQVASLSGAPLWTAPLHVVGAWMTAQLLDESAADLRDSKPTQWGGRDYDLGAETS